MLFRSFDFEMIFNLYLEVDIAYLDRISEAMELLEHDYLGGQGTRGYGQVRFVKRGAEARWFNGVKFDQQFSSWKQGFERNETEG